jgi:hypothetical protein
MAGIAAVLLIILPMPKYMEPRWYFSVDRAFEVARNRRVPVMLDLYDDQVRFRRWFDGLVYKDSRVVTAFKKVVPLRLSIHSSEAKPFVEKYGAKSTPFVLFLDADRRAFWRVTGRNGPEGFIRQIDQSLVRLPKIPRMALVTQSKKGTGDELADAAIYASVNGKELLARELLARSEKAPVRSDRLFAAYHFIGDSLRLSGREEAGLTMLKRASAASDPQIATPALYGVAIAYWRSQKVQPAINTLRRITEMGDRAGEYAYIARNMMVRMQNGPMQSR